MSSETDSSGDKGPYKCGVCSVPFAYKKTLNRHVRNKHSKNGKPCVCHHCKSRFNDKWAMGKHIESTHMKKHHVVICPICRYQDSKNMIDIHFSAAHGVRLEDETLKFDDLKEFEKWKNKIEKTTVARFVVNQKFKKKNGAERIIYNCHRSGFFKPRGSNKRKIKSQGTNKIMGFCPARLEFEAVEGGKIVVQFVKTHVGHDNDVDKVFSQYQMKLLTKKPKFVPQKRLKDASVQSSSDKWVETERIPVEKTANCQIVELNSGIDIGDLKPVLVGEFSFNNNVISIFRTTTEDLAESQEERVPENEGINTIAAIDLNGDVVGLVDVNILSVPNSSLDELRDYELSTDEIPCDAFVASLDLSKFFSTRLAILPDSTGDVQCSEVGEGGAVEVGSSDNNNDDDGPESRLARDKQQLVDRFRRIVDSAATPEVLWEMEKMCSPALELMETLLERNLYAGFKKTST